MNKNFVKESLIGSGNSNLFVSIGQD